MMLKEKMFSKGSTVCPVRSTCRENSDGQYFRTLFERDWEVFVIKRDQTSGGHKWFTQCCEMLRANVQSLSATGC